MEDSVRPLSCPLKTFAPVVILCASPKDVQAHFGHEDVDTTLRLYARVRPDRSADLAMRRDGLIAEGM